MKRKETKRNERHSYKRSNNEHPNIWKHMKNDHKKLEICGSIMFFFRWVAFYIYICVRSMRKQETLKQKRENIHIRNKHCIRWKFSIFTGWPVYMCVFRYSPDILSLCVSLVYIYVETIASENRWEFGPINSSFDARNRLDTHVPFIVNHRTNHSVPHKYVKISKWNSRCLMHII